VRRRDRDRSSGEAFYRVANDRCATELLAPLRVRDPTLWITPDGLEAPDLVAQAADRFVDRDLDLTVGFGGTMGSPPRSLLFRRTDARMACQKNTCGPCILAKGARPERRLSETRGRRRANRSATHL
jgi:hypothetical protein